MSEKPPNWNKGMSYGIPIMKPLELPVTPRRPKVYDGFTPEGYAYTLEGITKHIKCLFRSKDLEVYMYDYWRPCQFCDTRTGGDSGEKPDHAEDRIYVMIRGHIHTTDKDTEDAKAYMWSNSQIFCPKCFTDLNDMFVGLESNDP